jgi:hypothetical protein
VRLAEAICGRASLGPSKNAQFDIFSFELRKSAATRWERHQ